MEKISKSAYSSPCFPRWVQTGVLLSLLATCSANQKGPDAPTPKSEEAVGTTIQTIPETGANGDLPFAFREGLSECEKSRRYFDLGSAACTQTELAQFACTLENLLQPEGSVLSETLRTKLQSYIDANLKEFKLYACTESSESFLLHFYQVTPEKVRTFNVQLLKSSERS